MFGKTAHLPKREGKRHTFSFAWIALQNSSRPSPFIADMQIIPWSSASSFTLNGSSVLSICMNYTLHSALKKIIAIKEALE
jgi:hypothetical protein